MTALLIIIGVFLALWVSSGIFAYLNQKDLPEQYNLIESILLGYVWLYKILIWHSFLPNNQEFEINNEDDDSSFIAITDNKSKETVKFNNLDNSSELDLDYANFDNKEIFNDFDNKNNNQEKNQVDILNSLTSDIFEDDSNIENNQAKEISELNNEAINSNKLTKELNDELNDLETVNSSDSSSMTTGLEKNISNDLINKEENNLAKEKNKIIPRTALFERINSNKANELNKQENVNNQEPSRLSKRPIIDMSETYSIEGKKLENTASNNEYIEDPFEIDDTFELDKNQELEAFDKLPNRPRFNSKVETVCPNCRERTKHNKQGICLNCNKPNTWLRKRWDLVEEDEKLEVSDINIEKYQERLTEMENEEKSNRTKIQDSAIMNNCPNCDKPAIADLYGNCVFCKQSLEVKNV